MRITLTRKFTVAASKQKELRLPVMPVRRNWLLDVARMQRNSYKGDVAFFMH